MPAARSRPTGRRRLLSLVIAGLTLAGCSSTRREPTPDSYATVQTSIDATNTALRRTPTPTAPSPRATGASSLTPTTVPATVEARATPPPSVIATTQGPGPSPPDAARLRQQVAEAEAAIQTGSFDSVIDYGHGARATTSLTFDLGDGTRPPRLHLVTTYRGATGARTAEQIVIGDRAWEQRPDGGWRPIATSTRPLEQVQALLPQAGTVVSPASTGEAGPVMLAGYDARLNADVVLTINPATGTPTQLQRTSRATRLVATVVYRGWNTPVSITPPPEVVGAAGRP